MIKDSDIFIWIKENFTPNGKVIINSTDVTAYVLDSTFTKMATYGIGNCTLKLANLSDHLSWVANGDTVYFYADFSDATTLRFKGRIDFVKHVTTGGGGQVLELEGRHISYNLTETYVTQSYSGMIASDVLKDLVDTYLTGYTYTNTAVSATAVTVNWNYKPFWQCINDLCILAGFDCYVDDNLDFHFFKSNSIFRTDDAVVEGDTLIDLKHFGTDSFETRDKIIVTGQDEKGLPIIYTAGTGDREFYINDASIRSMEEAQIIAEGKLVELEGVDQTNVLCRGRPFVEPGENIWVVALRNNVYGKYKVIQISHKFGTKVGCWQSELKFEKELKDTNIILRERIKKEQLLTTTDNPNGLSFSYNFGFSDTSNILSQDKTEVSGGYLQLQAGETNGTMITTAKTMAVTATQVELKLIGEGLGVSLFYASGNNGISWTAITRDTLTNLTLSGKQIKIKVNLVADAVNTNPKIDSLSLLFG